MALEELLNEYKIIDIPYVYFTNEEGEEVKIPWSITSFEYPIDNKEELK